MPNNPGETKLDAQRYKIADLLDLVRQGRVRVPRFQRGLRWMGVDSVRLFDSIYRNYPIGTLLFWDRPARAERVTLGGIQIDAPETTSGLWVVDGQQRITSLAASLLPAPSGPGPSEIVFDLVGEEFSQARPGMPDTAIPVRSAYDLKQVLSWVKERDLPQDLQDTAFRLADRLRNYEIPAYVVSTGQEKVLQEIFDRTNTFGKRMTKGEVFSALNTTEDRDDTGVVGLEREVKALGFGLPTGGNTLSYCVLAVRSRDVFRDFRKELAAPIDWHNAMTETAAAFGRVRDFLALDADVPHFHLVPYQHQLVGLVRFFAVHPEPEPWVRVLLRRWFWQAAEVGPIPKKGNTGTLKATLSAIEPGDPYASVERLLDLSQHVYAPLDIGDGYRWTEAGTRVGVCALAALQPLAPDGRRLEVTEAVEMLGRDCLGRVVDLGSPGGRTLANRVFWPADSDEPRDLLRDAICGLPAGQRASLGVTASHLDMVAQGKDAEFLASRFAYLQGLVRSFLDARSDRGRPIRPSVEALLA